MAKTRNHHGGMTKPLSLEQIESARFEKWWEKQLMKDDELLYVSPLGQMSIKRYARKSWLASRASDCERKDISK